MKPTVLKLAALAALSIPVAAQADIYLKAGAFYVDPGDLKYDDGFKSALDSTMGYAVSLGYKFSLIRVEAEGQYYKSDLGDLQIAATQISTDGSKKNLNFFGNVYLDIPFPTPFIKPYVGAGLGFAKVKINQLTRLTDWQQAEYEYSNSENLFGWQLMLGLQISVAETVTVYGGFRYQDFGSISVDELKTMTRESISSDGKHIWEVGMAIGF